MEKTVSIINIRQYIGKKVKLQGWIFNVRSSGSIVFLQVRDGTDIIQATVVRDDVDKKTFELARSVYLEASCEIFGVARKEPRAPTGYEIAITDLTIIQQKEGYPIGKKEHGADFLLANRHFWIRSRSQWAILKIREELIRLIEKYFKKQSFTRIDTPIITPTSCEGTTTLFSIDYFGEPAYLSQSGQLYLEAAIASFGKVYDFAPVFRAEKSKTRRHLIEFWMTNAEAAFVDFEKNLKIQEQMIIFILKGIIANCKQYMEIIQQDISKLKKIKLPFRRIAYDKALEILHKLGSDIKKGKDFGNDDETLLMTHFNQPVFITKFPASLKAFYMKRDQQNPKLSLSADLLAPEGYGEIIGGGQREDDYEKLQSSIKKHQYNLTDFQWYLDLRCFGSVVHSGFGLGIERMLAWICGLKHVREATPFPRLLERMRP